MRTGVSYMGHHNPKHVTVDLEEIKSLGCDDVLLAAQENDFIYMTGKLEFFPKMAKDFGLRPLAIFWGALNYFGGGRSSQFLLEFPEAHQVSKVGKHNPAGCYNNPYALGYVKQMIDCIASLGFEGYFIDEPTVTECYCQSCQELFQKMFSSALEKADEEEIKEFRKKCVTLYVDQISSYTKENYPQMETLCCIMPGDNWMWKAVSGVKNLDNLGTDIYLVNEDCDLSGMSPLVKNLADTCKNNNKKHHQWLQCWGVKKGREQRIIEQGEMLLQHNPDALYVWGFQAQIGTSESCEDPQASWNAACEVLVKAKQ